MTKLLGIIFGAMVGVFSFVLDRWGVLGGLLFSEVYILSSGAAIITPYSLCAFIVGASFLNIIVSLSALSSNIYNKSKILTDANKVLKNHEEEGSLSGLYSAFSYNNSIERSPLASAIQDGMRNTNRVIRLYGRQDIPGGLDTELFSTSSAKQSTSASIIRTIRGA